MSNGVKKFKTILLKDQETTKLQNKVRIAIQPVLNSSIIDGTLIQNVKLQATKRNEVLHRLNREPLGYIIVRKRKDSRIWDLQDTNTAKRQTFTLACSHDVTVDIWFF